jgi:hypothetical protein
MTGVVAACLSFFVLQPSSALRCWYGTFFRTLSSEAHDFLTALPLAMIACACLVDEAVRRPLRSEVKAVLLTCAFLFWSANQLWPTLRRDILFNDIAIALFVFDVFLAMIGRPISVS